MTQDMLVVTDLCAGYAGGPVLENISLRVQRGEFVAVLGPNGSGKTTLLRAIAGVVRPSSGSVRVLGQNIHALAARKRAALCASVPQKSSGLKGLRTKAVVLMGRYPFLSFLGNYTQDDHQAAQAAMDQTQCADLCNRQCQELSGGEMQRVLVARALAQNPQLLLLDEVAAHLDVARAVDVYELLRARHSHGLTVLTVAHDLNLAALYCNRLIFMKQGRILYDGPTADIFTASVLQEIYETPLHVVAHPQTGAPQAFLVPHTAHTAGSGPEHLGE